GRGRDRAPPAVGPRAGGGGRGGGRADPGCGAHPARLGTVSVTAQAEASQDAASYLVVECTRHFAGDLNSRWIWRRASRVACADLAVRGGGGLEPDGGSHHAWIFKVHHGIPGKAARILSKK